MKQADSICQHSPAFVLNCPSKTFQSLAICNSSNCRFGRHKFQQKNALSVPQNRSHEFCISWLMVNSNGAIALIVAWIQVYGDKLTSRHLSQ
ncbi:hypothetical protein TNCV_4372201 [Trichonephila clavipes]|nr:hypothetical protein TNCV_4372201 [Trichonephila clavipes]